MVAHPASALGLPSTPRERLVFALDVEHMDEAERLVRLLATHVGMFKVGPALFTSSGSQVIDLIHNHGSEVFLDLKFHDIPETVSAAAREVARRRAKIFTVHALGGAPMIRQTVRELMNITLIPGVMPPQCIAVTVLTSLSEEHFRTLGFAGSIAEHSTRLAKLALESGAVGVVASGHEVLALRAVLPSTAIIVVPGIRSEKDPVGDQSRVVTAGEAIRAGATYLVVGRPIRTSRDPVDTARRFVDEIARATS